MKKKLMAVALATIVAVMAVAGASLAWLTDTTDEVANTFTYGDIDITLTENNLASGIDFTRVVPGDVCEVNAKVTVKANSEDCFVYVVVTNEIGNKISLDLDTDVWKQVAEKNGAVLYRYTASQVNYSTSDQPLTIFSEITFPTTLVNSDLDGFSDLKIKLKAYAHQAKHTSMNDADAAAKTILLP